jgi:hypothetical protein
MRTSSRRISSLDELRDFVNQTLCQNEQLELGAFVLTERALVRNGRPCGLYFCLHGPRAVKFTAIWETDRNTVLFYGATGERFLTIRLAAGPGLARAAA